MSALKGEDSPVHDLGFFGVETQERAGRLLESLNNVGM